MNSSKAILISCITLTLLLIGTALSSVLTCFIFRIGFENFEVFLALTYASNAIEAGNFDKLMLACGVGYIATFFGAAYLFSEFKSPRISDKGASFANHREISKIGYFKNHGIILGKHNGKYIIDDTPGHVFCSATTRAGKGAGLVIPNLLNWDGSVFCIDIKGENFEETAGFREKIEGSDLKRKVFRFSPLDHDENSHCYNPLDQISNIPHKRLTDLRKLSHILIPPKLRGDAYWGVMGRSLFIALCYFVIEREEYPSTIGAVLRLLGTEQELGDIARYIAKTYDTEPEIVSALNEFANKASKERSGIAGAMSEALNIFGDRVIDSATSKSDFSLRDLRKERISIYLCINTDDIATLSPLIRVMFEQLMLNLTAKIPSTDEPHRVLMVLDEFHMLGKMDSILSMFTLSAGYNCHAMAIVQGIETLDTVYEKNIRETIIGNCRNRVFMATNSLATAEYVCKLAGNKKITTESKSYRQGGGQGGRTKNISDKDVPLIPVSTFMNSKDFEQVIFVQQSKPINSELIKFFDDPNFKIRKFPPPSIPKLKIIRPNPPQFKIGEQPEPPSDPNGGNEGSAAPPEYHKEASDAFFNDENIIKEKEDEDESKTLLLSDAIFKTLKPKKS